MMFKKVSGMVFIEKDGDHEQGVKFLNYFIQYIITI
jgi:hypothetical protein